MLYESAVQANRPSGYSASAFPCLKPSPFTPLFLAYGFWQ